MTTTKTTKKTTPKKAVKKTAVKPVVAKKTAVKKLTAKKPVVKKPIARKTVPIAKKQNVKKAVSKIEAKNFAVIHTGGKQYLVRPGETLRIEKIIAPETGDTIIFEEILLVFDGKETKIGNPYVKGAKVTAKIEGDGRAKKITVLRYKSKTRYSKKKGHRQPYTGITIMDIK